eukprot:6200213-Pleurochrysis_carterae.AAC.3
MVQVVREFKALTREWCEDIARLRSDARDDCSEGRVIDEGGQKQSLGGDGVQIGCPAKWDRLVNKTRDNTAKRWMR